MPPDQPAPESIGAVPLNRATRGRLQIEPLVGQNPSADPLGALGFGRDGEGWAGRVLGALVAVEWVGAGKKQHLTVDIGALGVSMVLTRPGPNPSAGFAAVTLGDPDFDQKVWVWGLTPSALAALNTWHLRRLATLAQGGTTADGAMLRQPLFGQNPAGLVQQVAATLRLLSGLMQAVSMGPEALLGLASRTRDGNVRGLALARAAVALNVEPERWGDRGLVLAAVHGQLGPAARPILTQRLAAAAQARSAEAWSTCAAPVCIAAAMGPEDLATLLARFDTAQRVRVMEALAVVGHAAHLSPLARYTSGWFRRRVVKAAAQAAVAAILGRQGDERAGGPSQSDAPAGAVGLVADWESDGAEDQAPQDASKGPGRTRR